MKCVVFVPGILGSELANAANDQVWPPSVWELIAGYRRIDELLADGLKADNIVDSIGPYGVYKSILRDIEQCGYAIGGTDRRFVPYPYDWRKSNVDAAVGLAGVLDGIDDIDDLVLVGHSMGGLVLRYLLESGDFAARPWFEKISTLITLGTPHFGAPKMLALMLGKESFLGVRGPDLVRLATDSRYPSSYQLVPRKDSALTVPIVPPGQVPLKLDSFDSAIAAALMFNQNNVQSAYDFWAKLDLGRRPVHVAYFFFGSAAHKTAVRNEWDDPVLEPIERRQAGDGTVPIASAVSPLLPHGFSMKKHSQIFQDRDVRRALFRFLDAPHGVQPQSADVSVDVGEQEAFGISLDKDTYMVGEPMEVVASYNKEVIDPSEAFQILGLDAETGDRDVDVSPIDVNVRFEGVELTGFSVVIIPDLTPGLYEFRPTTRTVDDPEPTLFVVESDG